MKEPLITNACVDSFIMPFAEPSAMIPLAEPLVMYLVVEFQIMDPVVYLTHPGDEPL